MTKKRALFFFFLFFIVALAGIIYYREMNPAVKIAEEDSEKAKDKTEQESPVPRSLKIAKNGANSGEIKGARAVNKNEDEDFSAFDQMEKDWLSRVEGVIGTENWASYMAMRENADKEKMRAYKEYHDYLRLKYGDHFSYNISEDQSIREKKINEKYLNDLLKLIGQEKFKLYIKTKDQFNEELLRKNAQAIQIEF